MGTSEAHRTMATAILIPVSEYLDTTYRPDCDYLEGEVVERNVGERWHGRLQNFFGFIFRLNEAVWRVQAIPELRVQVRAERYRIPDVCVIRNEDPVEQIVRTPPLICIEVLSKKDTLGDLQERVNDYAAMGVQNIWAVDPWKRLAYYCSARGFQQPEDGFFRVQGTPIQVALSQVFAELDQPE